MKAKYQKKRFAGNVVNRSRSSAYSGDHILSTAFSARRRLAFGAPEKTFSRLRASIWLFAGRIYEALGTAGRFAAQKRLPGASRECVLSPLSAFAA